MPRRATPLHAKQVAAKECGTGKHGQPIAKLYADGGNLHLLVKPTGARSWVFRYTFGGRRIDLGLGPAGEGRGEVTLAEARRKAGDLQHQIRAGINPGAARRAEKDAARRLVHIAAVMPVTFRDVAGQYVAAHERKWRNEKHRAQWTSTLATYAYPHFGDMPVADIGTPDIRRALDPIWHTKTETASRVRGRIQAVLDYATVSNLREGPNPARWTGHLAILMPKPSEVAEKGHHAAMPWAAVGTFMQDLRKKDSPAALALEFTILTAARTGEALGARWHEIDLADAVWTVPAGRMKAGNEHRVPLTRAALAVLTKAAALRTTKAPDAYVFPGQSRNKPLSQMALAMLLRRMSRVEVTVHGFRSTFRDWVAEHTNFQSELAEAALAHTRRDKVEAAYARGDMFDKRRALMSDWATFCAAPYIKPAGKVVKLHATG